MDQKDDGGDGNDDDADDEDLLVVLKTMESISAASLFVSKISGKEHGHDDDEDNNK